jgi:hypothetical protein
MKKFENKGKENFLKELSLKQSDIYYNYIWDDFQYITNKTKSKVIDCNGLITFNAPKELLLGRKPSIESAEDKTLYFLQILDNLGYDWVNDYIWDEFVYINRKTKSILKDKLNNKFLVSPDQLLSNKPNLFSALNREEIIINEVKEKFKNYNFSKFIYNGIHKKSVVICSKHGEFLKSMHDIKRGELCPQCTAHLKIGNYKSLSEKDPNQIIYLYHVKLSLNDEEFFKIGLSKNPNKRFKQFSNYKVELIELVQGTVKNLNKMEQELKNIIYEFNIKYKPKNLFPGKHECYKW